MWVKRSGLLFIIYVTMFALVVMWIFNISTGPISMTAETVISNRVSQLSISNSKGVIYDRNFSPLAGRQPLSYLIVNPREFDRSEMEYLSKITKFDLNSLTKKLNGERPFVLSTYSNVRELKGVTAYDGYGRYAHDIVAQHLLGYLDSDCVVGLSGIERAYDDFLSAFSGSVSVKYKPDAVNGIVSDSNLIFEDHNYSENGVVLTLDKELSVAVEKSMESYFDSGCVVVMDCDNGEILALSCSPEYDTDSISKYINSNGGELINNAMVNQTVGSVFKIIIAATALRCGLDDFTYECNGGISVSDRVFHCQNNKEHGDMKLETAFSESCNSYFIALGQLLGYDKIIETAQLFGIDSGIGICDGIYSATGVLPEDDGNLSLANLSIGQGELMLSPLSIARMTSTVCNGGYLINPTVYNGLYIDGELCHESDYSYKSKILSDDMAGRLSEMCRLCVEEGTGVNATPSVGGAGGKTASAQTGIYNKDDDEMLNTYFTGFYPAENPKYVITVFAMGGESGSKTCAPVFREICDFIAQNY